MDTNIKKFKAGYNPFSEDNLSKAATSQKNMDTLKSSLIGESLKTNDIVDSRSYRC